MFRNPTAHDPRIARTVTSDELLEILTTISMIHRRLDHATVHPLSIGELGELLGPRDPVTAQPLQPKPDESRHPRPLLAKSTGSRPARRMLRRGRDHRRAPRPASVLPSLVGMVLVQGWWARNGVEVQGFATLALIVVTIVYVALTRSMAAAAKTQAATAEKQLAHMRGAAEAEQLATRRAQEHAESVALEAIRDRLSAMTPVVIVEVGLNHFGPQEGTSGGVVSEAEFSETTYELGVSFRCSNHGPGPTGRDRTARLVKWTEMQASGWCPRVVRPLSCGNGGPQEPSGSLGSTRSCRHPTFTPGRP